jgi:hypothetical protein
VVYFSDDLSDGRGFHIGARVRGSHGSQHHRRRKEPGASPYLVLPSVRLRRPAVHLDRRCDLNMADHRDSRRCVRPRDRRVRMRPSWCQ